MKTLAIVEDNPDNAALLEALLSDDFALVFYDDGEKAVAGIPTNPPDMVFLDISLPKLSGEEVLAQLKQNDQTRRIPIVALTAHAMVGDQERFLEMGFDGYVSKPIVDEEALFSAIERCLGGK